MKATINNTLLSQLKPSQKQYDVRDSKLKGFLIRVNPSGKMNYVCEYKRGRRVNLGPIAIMTPAQARDRAIEILSDAVKGIEPHSIKKPEKALSLRVFTEDEYQPWVLAHKKSGADMIARIKRCFYKLCADRPLTDITTPLIDQWRTQKSKLNRSKETINRDVAVLKAALAKAVEWGFIESHPLAKFKLFKVDTSPKVRYLSDKEEFALRQALDQREEKIRQSRANANEWRKERNYTMLPNLYEKQFADHLKPMVLFSINTGVRQGELFKSDWKNIDWIRKILTIPGDIAKSGKTRHIPLNEEVFSVIKKWHEQTSGQGLIFTSKDGNKFDNVHKAWHNVLNNAQIQNFCWHDMRHHFASRLVMAGVDLNTVRELLGHSDMKTTLRYAHLAPEHKAEAVARLVRKNNSGASVEVLC